MSRNSAYWQKRFEALELAQEKISLAYYHNICHQYDRAAAQIQQDIENWYSRFAANEGISLVEAKRLLNTRELKAFRMTVEEYIEKGQTLNYSKQWAKELERASTKFHVSRLEALQLQMQQQVESVMAKEVDGVDKLLRKIYKDGYYHTAFEVQKGIGIGHDLMQLDEDKISKLLDKPWAADGSNFSERIWGKHRAELVRYLENDFTQAIIRGDDPQKVVDQVAKRFGVGKSRAGNLIMTESAFFSSTAQQDCLNDLDVEQYEVVATLDSRTSDICRSMDGKHFPMKEYEIGVTAPPFHNRCRSTTCPYFDDAFSVDEMRAARNEDGEYYLVPADMKYEDWVKAFVDGGEKEGLQIVTVTDFLIRSHTPGQNTRAERRVVTKAVSMVPQRVQDALSTTIIDVGKMGASQYDYVNDILYVAKGADEEAVIHEIGHMVENKLIDETTVLKLKDPFITNVLPKNIIREIYYDAQDNPVEILLLKNEGFVSEYQGRLYEDDINNIFDAQGMVKPELMQEFISEPFREYIQNPEKLREMFPMFYELFKEVLA